jgi:uncharacterized protein YndB with AHSA1/START domain
MEKKIAFTLEYQVKSSPRILFGFLSVPTAMAEWFADKVDVQKELFSFTWDGYTENARLIALKEAESVRFEWIDGEREGCTFEMQVKVDDLTGDVALMILEECPAEEKDDIKRLWDASVSKLMKAIGSF